MRHLSVLTSETLSGASVRFRATAAIAALLLALACVFTGCSSDDDDDGDNNGAAGSSQAGSGGSEDDDGTAGADPEPDAGEEPGDEGISLTWMVWSIDGDESITDWLSTGAPNEGVEVCLIENIDIPCVATDWRSAFVLPDVPKNSELLLTFTKEDYVPMLVSVKTAATSVDRPALVQPLMTTTSLSDEWLDAAGVVLDESKGHMVVAAHQPGGLAPLPGRLSVSIDPATGDGPFYLDTNFQIDLNATGFSEEISGALFYNLEEGEYVVSWEIGEPEKMSCEIQFLDGYISIYGLLADQPNQMRVKVRAGYTSGLNSIACTATADPGADAGG